MRDYKMSLYIGGQKIAAISGPVVVSILRHTNKLIMDLGCGSPVLMLVGDHHGLTNRCNEDAKHINETYDKGEGIILRMMDKSFYHALDALATEDRPIDYYIESFFPLKLLQEDKYLKFDRDNFIAFDESILRFLPSNYLSCFSSKNTKKKQELCFTKHIRYHLVDLRFAHSNFNFDDEDIMQNKDMPYESEIITNLICCSLVVDRIIPIHEGSNIAAIDVLKNACDNPRGFAEWFYDFNNKYFLDRSLIIKQTTKLSKSFHTDIQHRDKTYNVNSSYAIELRQIFLDYYDHFMKRFLAEEWIADSIVKIKECLEKQNKFLKTKNISVQFDETPRCGYVHHDLLVEYSKHIQSIINVLAGPLLDIYFLFRCWKNMRYNGWLSVLNAGYAHTENIRVFLLERGYYEEVFLAVTEDVNNRCLQMKNLVGKLVEDPLSFPDNLVAQDLHLETLNVGPKNNDSLSMKPTSTLRPLTIEKMLEVSTKAREKYHW